MIDLSVENKNVVEDIRSWVRENKKWFGESKGIDAVDENGDTLLMLAIKNENMEAIKEILTYPQNLDVQNKWGKTALIRATAINNSAVVRSLLTKGAKPDIQDSDGMTAAIFAAINDNPIMMVDLKRAKANFEIKDNSGWTSLMWGISTGSFDAIEKLMHFGVSLEGIEKWMDTASSSSIAPSNRIRVENLMKKAEVTKKFFRGNGGR